VISVQAIVTSIELRNPTESQPIEITQFIFQSASKGYYGVSLDPVFTGLDVRTFHRRPGDPVRGFLLPGFPRMRGIGVIERLAINILGVFGKMSPDGSRQISIRWIGHQLLRASRPSSISNRPTVTFDTNQSASRRTR